MLLADQNGYENIAQYLTYGGFGGAEDLIL